MARLIFSNVPTSTGGVISGNIGIGAGSPFGEGGKYEAQISDIKATIAKAPKGFYDPVGWDDFLKKEELYSEQLPEGVRFIKADDPEILEELLKIPSARNAIIGLDRKSLQFLRSNYSGCGTGFLGLGCSAKNYWEMVEADKNFQKTIALHVNQLMLEKNAPLIQAIEEHERQLEIDQAVKLALEQKVRETAKPTPEPTPTPVSTPEPTPTPVSTPEPTPTSTISILPIIIIAVALIGILLFLRRRA